MTLNREKLQQTLDELHAQLDEAESVDAELAAQLRSAAADITRTLEKQSAEEAPEKAEEAASEDSTPSPDMLEEAAVEFEQSHPTIAGTIRRVIDMLAQMGI